MSTVDKIKGLINEQAQNEGVKSSELVSLQIQQIDMKKITPQIKKQIQKCKNLQTLCIVDCGLQSLDNLPSCNISAIDLSKNKLSDSQLSKLTTYSDLQQIMLAENNISNLQTIKTLSKLQNLQEIQLDNNPVSKQQNYQNYIFQNLQNLVYLDGKDKDGNQIPEEDEFQDQDQDQDQEDPQDDDPQDDDEDQQDDDQEQSPQPQKRR